jgi:hypothetical protein
MMTMISVIALPSIAQHWIEKQQALEGRQLRTSTSTSKFCFELELPGHCEMHHMYPEIPVHHHCRR